MRKPPKKAKTKYTFWFTTPQNKVGYLHIQPQKSRKNYKTFLGHAYKSSLSYMKHNTKYIKALATNR
jgi:hypothetical protein